ncbi:hypothetical protein AAG612_08055 [Citromicrobium bathyomarinum]|uniref:hypothetical protein n=1 Tax=Citromicrobium bathyomarinum TaxID=72174 RepID=UPI00315AFC91
MLLRLALLLIALSLSVEARASDWLRAETEHFVIHADLEEEDIRALAVRLESFLILLDRQVPHQVAPARKHHVFLDKHDGRISSVTNRHLGGYAESWPEIDASFSVFSTRYGDQFRHLHVSDAAAKLRLSGSFIRPMVPWLSHGLTGYFSTAMLGSVGKFVLGVPDVWYPMTGKPTKRRFTDVMLVRAHPTDSSYADFKRTSGELVRGLLSDPANDAKIEKYLQAYNAGGSMEDGVEIIGDLAPVLKSARSIARGRPTLHAVAIGLDWNGPVTVRAMGDDEIALVDIRFRRLLDHEREDVARDLLRMTERFPDSADVWYEYAAAEFALYEGGLYGPDRVFRGLGNTGGVIVVTARKYSDENAWRAANRALEIDPDQPQARRLKAEIMLARMVRNGEFENAEGFEEVRAVLAPLVAEPGKHPLAAALNYESFVEQGIAPPQDAFDALGRAFIGNAGVEEVRYAYAVALARRGERELARTLLESMLNNPDYREAAQSALDLSS